MTDSELAVLAVKAMENSYSPYSGFKVGAALESKSGKVFTGCNVENAAFTPTCCAERVALFKAVSEGEREFKKIAVAGGKSGNIDSVCTPCGVCRQALAEFCGADFKIICAGRDEVKSFTLSELLPHSFSSEDVL
ncbi:MAG: cytidine deaminase [Acutalibacteraceae bacterium]